MVKIISKELPHAFQDVDQVWILPKGQPDDPIIECPTGFATPGKSRRHHRFADSTHAVQGSGIFRSSDYGGFIAIGQYGAVDGSD